MSSSTKTIQINEGEAIAEAQGVGLRIARETMSAAKALNLIASQPRTLTERGHAIINAGIANCLRLGWVVRNPRKATAYELTAKGKATMSAMRTGVPLP